jgi:AAA15 family ATPase/GTPase
MFKKLTLKNYRTHVDTTLDLKGVTLLIGGNNSGKSNLFAGIQHFAHLISRTFQAQIPTVGKEDYFPHKHSLDNANTPMAFACEWENAQGRVVYEMALYALNADEVACQEKMVIAIGEASQSLEQGYAEVSQVLCLNTQLENANLLAEALQLAKAFFQDLTQVYSYNLQLSFLRGLAKPNQHQEIDYANVNIARDLGKEGANFQALLKYVVEEDKNTYKRLKEFIKFVDSAFQGFVIKDEQVFWQFDISKNASNCQELPSTVISDGIIKGSAVVLLCTSENPPALIMIDEVENGISLGNVRELLSWLHYTAGKGKKMPFLLTTHSPSFICEFSDDLDAVYNTLLQPTHYKSLLTTLSDGLYNSVKWENVYGDIVEQDGKELVIVKPYQLTELFYSGVLINI